MSGRVRRRLSVAAVLVVALLVVTATPAAAATTATASMHTSFGTVGDEPAPATLENVSIRGSGDSAHVAYGTFDTVDRNPDDAHYEEMTAAAGLVIETQREITDVTIELSSQTSGATTAYVINDSNGDIIATTSISNDEASFDITLDAGVKYRLAVDGGGNGVVHGYNDQPNFPFTGPLLNITTGVRDAKQSSPFYIYGGAPSIRYVTARTAPTGNGTYVSATHNASRPTTGWTDLTVANSTATVTWQGYDGTSWIDVANATYTTDGNKTLSLSGDYDKWRVNVSFTNETGQTAATIQDEGLLFEAKDPAIDNSSLSPNNTKVNSEPVTLEANVTDPDFATAQGDTVTLGWYVNGALEKTTSVSSNGTATVDVSGLDAGSNDWHVEATDDYGNGNTSATATFDTPGQLTVYQEQHPTQLVDSVEVKITFYYENGTKSDIYYRNTTTGTVDMSGLPADKPFTAVAKADGYHNRRVYSESLYDNQDIYLLNTSATSLDQIFVLQDYTGDYPADDTVLYIRRPLNGTWETVSSDYFGAAGKFPTTLEEGVRHRLILYNTQTGARKTLGYYTPISETETELTVYPSGEADILTDETAVVIEPNTETLPRDEINISAIVAGGEGDVTNWSVTITYDNGTQTVLNSANVTGAGSEDIALNLTDKRGGAVEVDVQYELDDGTSGSLSKLYRVQDTTRNQYSLIATLGQIPTLLPSGNWDAFATMTSIVVAVMMTGAVASQFRLSSEAVAFVFVLFLLTFAVLGWIGWDLPFAAIAAMVALTAIRRGL